MNARRRVLAACVTIVLVMLAADCSASPGPLADVVAWTQFRLNQANNAVVDGSLRAFWRVETGGAFSSSPAVAGHTLYIGNNAGELYAVDVMDGRVEWTRRVQNPIMSAPIVAHGVVIVAEGNENSPSNAMPARPIHVGDGPNALLGLDAATGRVLWEHPLAGTGMPTPAIVDGILVHHDGAGMIVGLNPLTGAALYERNIHSIASMVAALPVGSKDWVTAGEGRNAIFDLRAGDGTVVWKTTFSRVASGLGDCPPVTDGARIYCDYIMPPSKATPVVVGDLATEHVYAVDAKNGKKTWEVRLESGTLRPRNEAAIPLLAEGRLYLGSSLAPYVNALDPRNGRVLWRTRVRAPVLGGAVAVDGTIYFGDLAGYLWAVDAKTGRIVGDMYAGTAFNVGSPVVVGRTLVIGSRGGAILAVPLRDIRSSHAV
jgi:outer membrane protein assembly factor BamB